MIITAKMQWLPSVNTVDSKRDNNHCGAAFPPCPALCGYSSVVISFTSVGRHFPKNMALQSENPNR